jgi:glutamyl-tRNA reductase
LGLVVVGLDHHTASVDIRERCALRNNALLTLMYQLSTPPIRSVVILSTCNRLEVYADVHHSETARTVITRKLTDDFHITPDTLYSYEGQAAVNHLFRVACGLESMVLGESQILGQVSHAYTASANHHPLTPDLHRLFSSALQTGKRTHTETRISQTKTSVAHAALTFAKNPISFAVIGTGEIAEQALHAIRTEYPHSSIHIISRRVEPAKRLADQVQGVVHRWGELWPMLSQVDCVITATSAHHPILQAVDLQPILTNRQTPLTLIDIALPRDVDPSARDLDGLYLFDIDDVQRVVDANLRQRQACVPQVERIIAEEQAAFIAWWHGRDAVPTIAELRRKVQAVVHAELQDTLSQLSHLEAKDRQLIERLAHRLGNKILHSPTMNLRQRAQTGEEIQNYSQVVRELFALLPDDGVSHAG